MSRFIEALHSGRVLLMDGAMGTELQRAGIQEGECYELWNRTHPDRVRAIHQAYLDSGAEVLLTHTFQANPALLAKRGLADQWQEINRAALDVARSISGPDHFVLFDMGPCAWLGGPTISAKAYGDFIRSFQPDALLLETMSDLGDLVTFLDPPFRGGDPGGVPLLFSLTFRRDESGNLAAGHDDDLQPPEYYAERIRKWNLNVAALGVNCGRDIDMDDIIAIVRRYRAATDLPLFARPNAGTPQRKGKKWVYPHTPKQMAERLPELLEAGVRMVGGCCGTTPEHIAAFRPIIDEWNTRR